MDKYQRKMLRRRDEYIGTRNQPIVVVHKSSIQLKHQFIRETMMNYIPCPVTFLARVIELSLDPWFPLTESDLWWWDDSDLFNWNSRYITLQSRRLTIGIATREYGRLWSTTDLVGWYLQPDPYETVRSDSNVKREIAKLQTERDERYIARHAHECIRTMKRTAQIKSELLSAHLRIQSILSCHRIKEELYMSVYNPRRIERLLELGGWEALENFAGL